MFSTEKELTHDFIRLLEEKYEKDFKIFTEVGLRWGNIDVVLVQYSSQSGHNYSIFKDRDYALVYCTLFFNKGLTTKYLEKLKLDRTIEYILKKMIELDFVYCVNNKYYKKKLSDLPKIISYELKLKDMKKVIQQANINKKFSAESYIVIPHEKCMLIEKYSSIIDQTGLGVITVSKDSLRQLKKSKYSSNVSNFKSINSIGKVFNAYLM